MRGQRCLHFTLGGEGFGVPIDEVREIVPVGAVSAVPLAPATVRGVINIRGRVVTLIDVARMHGREPAAVRLAEDRLAVVLVPPHDHLALYLHAPVEIADVSTLQCEVAASQQGAPSASHTFPGSPAGGRPVVAAGKVLHLLSVEGIVERCRDEILAGYLRSQGAAP